jgi:hypothetical protein
MRERNKKKTKSNISSEEFDVSEDESVGDKKKTRMRVENSLGELTKNFINFIKDQGQKDININELVKKLKVKKRRVYDITNVLEGILKLFFYFKFFLNSDNF